VTEAIDASEESTKQLLLLMGEELKISLIGIAQLSELKENHETIRLKAQQALRTIDNILLYQRLHSGQQQLQLEPVHIGSAVHDVAYTMKPMMDYFDCSLEVDIQHGLAPVDVDRKVLYAGMASLWQAFLGTMQLDKPSVLQCRAYRGRDGVRITLLSKSVQTDKLSLFSKSGRWTSKQPLKDIAGPATDIIAAKGMFYLLGGELRKTTAVATHGLGVTFAASKQLQMV